MHLADVLQRPASEVFFRIPTDNKVLQARPSGRCVGLQFPLGILRLYLERQWTALAASDALTKLRKRSPLLNHLVGTAQINLNFGAGEFVHQPSVSLEPRIFTEAARDIRGNPVEEGDDAVSTADILAWLDNMSEYDGQGLGRLRSFARSRDELTLANRDGRGVAPYTMETLVRSMI